MSIEDIIELLTKYGKVLTIGKHTEGLTGYFCTLTDKEPADSWQKAGHGSTPKKSIKNLIKVKNGRRPKPISEFEESGSPWSV